jgi:hypothetical protein
LVITVPEERMYEHLNWPSRYNPDHKWSFTFNAVSPMPKSVNVLTLCMGVNDIATVDKIQLIDEFFFEGADPNLDQTLLPGTECCIEIILRKI